MKQKITQNCLLLLSVGLLSIHALRAQDTIVRKTTVIQDTVVKKVNDDHKLYMGEFGLRYLPTFTSLSVRNANGDVIEGKAAISHGFGIMLARNFSKMVGLQLEINYDQISQKYKDGELDRQVSINYINVPLLLAVNTDKTYPVYFGVVAGPQFGFNIGSSFSESSPNAKDTLQAELAVKQGDVGLAYGAGLGIALNPQRSVRLDIGFRGVYGLVDMSGKPTGANSYNILVTGSRKAYGGYAGITFLF